MLQGFFIYSADPIANDCNKNYATRCVNQMVTAIVIAGKSVIHA